MKKIFFTISLVCLLLVIFVPLLASADDGIVPCNGPDCTINSFFTMLGNIYRFIITKIVTSLAVIGLTVGGILLLISAGNPNLSGLGKKAIWASIIGLALAFGSYLIINFILSILGYTGNWSVL